MDKATNVSSGKMGSNFSSVPEAEIFYILRIYFFLNLHSMLL